MEDVNTSKFNLNQFEYCYLVEDTDPCARTMKIRVPKLHGNMTSSATGSTQSVNKSGISNSSESSVDSTATVQDTGGTITARVSLELAHRHSFHDCPGNCVNLVHTAQTCHSGTSNLKVCHHYHHDHHFPHSGETGKIPAGTKMICMFMDNNVNDCFVTRMLCDMPDGRTNGDPPREKGR